MFEEVFQLLADPIDPINLPLVFVKVTEYILVLVLVLAYIYIYAYWASLLAQRVNHLPAMSGDPGSIPGSGRSPGEGNGNPLQ